MLADSPLHKSIVFNLTRELIGTHIQPHLYGTTTENPIPLSRGAKEQGSPESGLLFTSTINWALAPIIQKWREHNIGVPLGDAKLTHLLFVDDLILLSTHPHTTHNMLKDLLPTLAQIGLSFNEAKTSYLTTSPAMAAKLPGTNANKEGLKILGRTFKLTENTGEEETRKIGAVWGKFHSIRRILSAPTPLPHRLTIFKACIGHDVPLPRNLDKPEKDVPLELEDGDDQLEEGEIQKDKAADYVMDFKVFMTKVRSGTFSAVNVRAFYTIVLGYAIVD